MRNTRVVDIFRELKSYKIDVDVYDPWCDAGVVKKEYGIDLIPYPVEENYDGIIIAVAHDQFVVMIADGIRALGKERHVLYDLKYVLTALESDVRL